ncbi:hypothetical protein FF38_04457 [Lucilia cuprina]|uniref:Uncharacterized protein n=1 Tax=Lucilia cuprina TaxID=7375 RepID=A0A0L0C9E2_LUCCU|nr:hypothetical protein FF38_04457 [Lucilia cuprina]
MEGRASDDIYGATGERRTATSSFEDASGRAVIRHAGGSVALGPGGSLDPRAPGVRAGVPGILDRRHEPGDEGPDAEREQRPRAFGDVLRRTDLERRMRDAFDGPQREALRHRRHHRREVLDRGRDARVRRVPDPGARPRRAPRGGVAAVDRQRRHGHARRGTLGRRRHRPGARDGTRGGGEAARSRRAREGHPRPDHPHRAPARRARHRARLGGRAAAAGARRLRLAVRRR